MRAGKWTQEGSTNTVRKTEGTKTKNRNLKLARRAEKQVPYVSDCCLGLFYATPLSTSFTKILRYWWMHWGAIWGSIFCPRPFCHANWKSKHWWLNCSMSQATGSPWGSGLFRSILNYHQAELCESVTTLPWPCMSKSHECHDPQGCWALIKCFSVAAHQCSFIWHILTLS